MDDNGHCDDGVRSWSCISDDLLLTLFVWMDGMSLLRLSKTCKQWHRVALDELLWKKLFCRIWSVKLSTDLAPGKVSWLEEYKRLHLMGQVDECEVLREHKDEVWHVSFSNDGTMFCSCSKDGTVQVWNSSYPATLKYKADMREVHWRHSSFSQFNRNDELLLVAGLHQLSNVSGEVCIFSLQGSFQRICMVINKPYNMNGAWYDDRHFISADFRWQRQNIDNSMTCVCLNNIPTINRYHPNKDRILVPEKTLMFSNAPAFGRCGFLTLAKSFQLPGSGSDNHKHSACRLESELQSDRSACSSSSNSPGTDTCQPMTNTSLQSSENTSHLNQKPPETGKCQSAASVVSPMDSGLTKLLILVRCSKVRIAHEVCIKKLTATTATKFQKAMEDDDEQAADSHEESSKEDTIKEDTAKDGLGELKQPISHLESIESDDEDDEEGDNDDVDDSEADDDEQFYDIDYVFDDVDHVIEFSALIRGIHLSPDNRYLFVNSRRWLSEPLDDTVAEISGDIQLNIIDLTTMEILPTVYTGHKAFTEPERAFILFPDVSEEYVASGGEDGFAYVWDRHYCTLVSRFKHDGPVNCTAINPKDQSVIVSASDDSTLKVWRTKTTHS